MSISFWRGRFMPRRRHWSLDLSVFFPFCGGGTRASCEDALVVPEATGMPRLGTIFGRSTVQSLRV